MSEVEHPHREWLFDFLSKKDSEYLYCVVRDWNWDNGTWLPKWIAQNQKCTRSVAQLIFWRCEPEAYLPTSGLEEWRGMVESNKDVYELIGRVLENWNGGHYRADQSGLLSGLKSTFGFKQKGFLGDGNKIYLPGQIGYFHPENPVPWMEAFRKAEARCHKTLLTWKVPDDIGVILIQKRPGFGKYGLSEGFPEEYIDYINKITNK
jgi:Domain of unknown function (DUF4274)